VPGTLDLLILRTLQAEALHGRAISERIQQISGDVLQVNRGSLYRHSIASNTRAGYGIAATTPLRPSPSGHILQFHPTTGRTSERGGCGHASAEPSRT
jgi:hypothetical protein